MNDKHRAVPITGLIALGLAAKFFVDTTSQIFLPFLPLTAAGLGISVLGMGRLVSVQSFAGLTAPLSGSLADKIGHKTVMRLGLLLCGVGMLCIASNLGVVGALAGMVLNGIGVAAFTPNLHAYLSVRLPYNRRARGLAICEFSWALAGIVGLFLAGHLIEQFSWNTPLFVVAGGLLVFCFVYAVLPGARPAPTQRVGAHPENSKTGLTVKSSRNSQWPGLYELKKFFALGKSGVSAWAAIAASGLLMFGISNIMIVHGAWLKSKYGLGAGQLGNVAFLFGVVDWVASITVSLFVDRIGKKRALLIGIGGTVAGYALLPFLDRSLTMLMLGFCIPRLFFEFGIVSNFPLLSEQNPSMRGKILSFNLAAGFVGRMLSGLTGPWLLAAASLAAAITALLTVLILVRENSEAKPGQSLD